MRRYPLVQAASLLVALLVAGCARVQTPPEPETGPEERLHRALIALERRDYGGAGAELAWLHSYHRAEPLGQQAYLLLIALALDPRNPDGHPNQAAALAAEDLSSAARARWSLPISETLYLLAVELGADPMKSADGAGDWVVAPAPRPLPTLGRAALATRVVELEAAKEELSRRIARLEQDVTRRDQELARKEQELERIRKTLRP